MVVDRSTLEEALFHATFLSKLIVKALDDDREALHEEYATEDGDEQFFADDDGAHGNDTTDGEATRVAHEYLGGEGIIP